MDHFNQKLQLKMPKRFLKLRYLELILILGTSNKLYISWESKNVHIFEHVVEGFAQCGQHPPAGEHHAVISKPRTWKKNYFVTLQNIKPGMKKILNLNLQRIWLLNTTSNFQISLCILTAWTFDSINYKLCLL